MTFDDALEELGLAQGASAEQIRRAYLRLLKKCSPEKNPTGFARLREAFEAARAGGEGEPLPAQSPQTPADWAQTGPAADAGGEGAFAAGDSPELQPFRKEFADLGGEAPVEAPIEIARRAVAAHPESREARLWLASALAAAGNASGAVASLREAAASGMPEMLGELALRFPPWVTDEDLERLAETAAPELLWTLTDHFLALGDFRGASGAASAGIRALRRAPDGLRREPDFFGLLLLKLQEEDLLEEARKLAHTYAEWIDELGLAEAFAFRWAGGRWHQILAMGALPAGFPPALRRLLNAYIANPDVEALLEALKGYAAYDAPALRRAQAQLRAAPRLQELADALDLALAPTGLRAVVKSAGQWAAAGLLFLSLGPLLGLGIGAATLVEGVFAKPSERALFELRLSVDELCRSAEGLPQGSACASARELSDHVSWWGCLASRGRAEQLERDLSSLADSANEKRPVLEKGRAIHATWRQLCEAKR